MCFSGKASVGVCVYVIFVCESWLTYICAHIYIYIYIHIYVCVHVECIYIAVVRVCVCAAFVGSRERARVSEQKRKFENWTECTRVRARMDGCECVCVPERDVGRVGRGGDEGSMDDSMHVVCGCVVREGICLVFLCVYSYLRA